MCISFILIINGAIDFHSLKNQYFMPDLRHGLDDSKILLAISQIQKTDVLLLRLKQESIFLDQQFEECWYDQEDSTVSL